MPRIKLFASPGSPYARKVRIALAEKQIPYELVLTSASAPDSPVPKVNPLGKVPVALVDDTLPLYDSGVIIEYLETLSPSPPLLPAVGMERVQVRRWDALGQGICEAAVSIVHERNLAAETQRPDWIAKQRTKVENGLATAARDLGDREWCHGGSITLADITLGMALGWISLRLPDFPWRRTHPNLAAYQARLEKRKSFVDSAPPPISTSATAAPAAAGAQAPAR